MNLVKQYIVIFLAVLMTACGSGGGDSAPAADTQEPSIVSGGTAQTIQSSSQITVIFSEGVDRDSLDLAGTNAISAGLSTVSWNTATETDDTLILTASTQWITGAIVIAVADAAGNILNTSFNITVDDTSPTGTATPISNAALSASESIVLNYDEAVVESSIIITGSMQTSASVPVLTGGTSLSISPDGSWAIGDNQTLTVTVTDAVGNIAINNLTYHILGGVVYVDITNGSDVNSGSLAFPKGTIQAGITAAQNAFTTGEVRVAAGTYTEAVTMADGISLLGGYPVGFATRDVAANVTVINSTASNTTLTASNMVTSNTLLDGFTINGSSGVTITRGVYVSGSSTGVAGLTISNNIINGGAGSTTSYGMYITGNVNVTNNVINGGTGASAFGVTAIGPGEYSRISPSVSLNTISGGGQVAGYSTGMSLMYSSSNVWENTINAGSGGVTSLGLNYNNGGGDIYKNHIEGGAGTSSSTGLVVGRFNSTIYNNTIYGGSSSTIAIAVKMNSESISLNSVKLYNNTIDAGSSASTNYGIAFLGSSSSNIISNNNIIGRDPATTTCLRDQVTTDSLTSLQNNNLFQCDTLYYNFAGSYVYEAIVDLHTATAFIASGNVSVDPVVVSATDYHLTASSPALIKTGGLNLSASFTDDKDGVARVFSMGAYVYVSAP